LSGSIKDVPKVDLWEPFFYKKHQYYTVGQVARLLDKSPQTICNYIKRGARWGRLRAVRLPPFGDMLVIPVEEINEERFPEIGE